MMLNVSTMKLKDIPNKKLAEAAPAIGTSTNYLIQIKLGFRNPSKAMAERIEKVLGVPKERVMWPDSECCPCEEKAANE